MNSHSDLTDENQKAEVCYFIGCYKTLFIYSLPHMLA
jgi:hypothetical protein